MNAPTPNTAAATPPPPPPPPFWAGMTPGTITKDEKGNRFIVPPPVSTDPALVNILLDGKQFAVKKGQNVIEAAKGIGVDIPHYCYHPHLSIAGNCRMCQIRVQGLPKMEIGCNMQVRDQMVIESHHSSKEVAQTQAAVLELILINHPLDCTVCDQAGQCKLQDYHFEYNAKSSRFIEEKEHKVKAESLGNHVMLDGERCIMCTRCIRFCDEVTKTSELGMLNRGDRSVIAVSPGRELNNPLSGTVVDLCPVGALTHKDWRFNTRIWFTDQKNAICPGCSTGCNVKVASRDGEVVQVKARLNSAVNKEWLCDEGRYGFNRFLPTERVLGEFIDGEKCDVATLTEKIKQLNPSNETLVFMAPDLLTEEYLLIKKFFAGFANVKFSVAFRPRTLTATEQVLISPDYAANYQGAIASGLLLGEDLEKSYESNLARLREGNINQVFIFGDRAIESKDADAPVTYALTQASHSIAILTDNTSELAGSAVVLLAGHSILEKSGVMVNRNKRAQYTDIVVQPPQATTGEITYLKRFASLLGIGDFPAFESLRELTAWGLAQVPGLASKSIKALKDEQGVSI